MANSDNVLRGGLTPKHVDCDELLATLSFESGPAEVLRAQVLDRACSRWVTAVADFELTRIELTGGSWEGVPRGPELWLGLGGELELSVGGERLRLARGGAACVAGSGPRVRVRGAGWAMRATVGAIREG
jgi:mannose-6-phosphate isomerase